MVVYFCIENKNKSIHPEEGSNDQLHKNITTMRKMMKTLLVAVMMLTATNGLNAQPMSYGVMRDHARFLTDRMAFTLGLRGSVLDAVYMINFDYIYGVNEYLDDIALGYTYAEYDDILYRRDLALRRLLSAAQWARYMTYDYFYRPIVFADNGWRFSIYAYDTRHAYYHYGVPRHYRNYRGGHYFQPMRVAHRPHLAPRGPIGPRPHREGVYAGRRNDMPHGGHMPRPNDHRDRNMGGYHNGNGHQGHLNDNRGNMNQNRGNVDHNRGNVNNNRGNVDHNRGNVNNNRGNVDRNRGNVDRNRGNVNNNRGNVDRNRTPQGGNFNNRGGQSRGGNFGGGQGRGGNTSSPLIRTSAGSSSRAAAGQGSARGARGGRH